MSIDELRPLPALRLLTIRQEMRGKTDDEQERAARCNAQVLSECCYFGNERVFPTGESVLAALTFREMETLLRALAASGGAFSPREAIRADNPGFDSRRFAALRNGEA